MKKNSTNQFKKLFASLAIPAIALFLSALSEKECVAQNSLEESGLRMNTAGTALDIRLKTKEDKPLFLIDGKEASDIEHIDVEGIHSISVLKNQSAVKLYGEKAKNGVVLITTKAYATQHDIPELLQGEQVLEQLQQQMEQVEQVLQQPEVKENLSALSKLGDITDKPLILVDGKETSDIENLSFEDIDSISVLKNQSAVKLYGEKAKNGVILITTKKGKE